MTKPGHLTNSCTCRELEHKPADCPYPNGCTGCICDLPRHAKGVSTWCQPCGEHTVHPDRHEHPTPGPSDRSMSELDAGW